MKVSFPTLAHVAKYKLVNELAFCIKFKDLYKNSCIYKGTIKALPEKMGCSRTKVSRGIKFIIDQKWGRWHHGNLILNNKYQIDRLYRTKKGFPKNFVTINSKLDIQHALIENRLNQKKFIKTKQSDANTKWKRVSKKTRKILNGSEKRYVDDGLSCKAAGKVLGLSASQASRTLKSLSNAGKIKIEKRRLLLGVFNKHMYSLYKLIYESNNIYNTKRIYINNKGEMYINQSSKITLQTTIITLHKKTV